MSEQTALGVVALIAEAMNKADPLNEPAIGADWPQPDHFHRHPDGSFSPCDCEAASVPVGHSGVQQREPVGSGPGQGVVTDATLDGRREEG